MQRDRRHITNLAVTAALIMLAAATACADDVVRVSATEAADHIGEIAEVCGTVASAAHIAAVKGQPTFLNFDRPYPDQPFTVVIWGRSRSQFDGRPERMFDGKEICVTGKIERYRGKPQIVVDSPSQIVLVNPVAAGLGLTETERILVKALLSSLGHDVHFGSGEWDDETTEAAIAFQEEAGVAPTGEPDAATLRALADAVLDVPAEDQTLVIRLLLFELARRWE